MKLRVLIADDAPFIHEVLRKHLSNYDAEILGNAYTGKEAVRAALVLRPDLIFMDLAMPEENGIEASKRILSHFPEAQIIAMSSMSSESIIAAAISVGCVDYLDKSFSVEKFRDAIQSVRARIFSRKNLEKVAAGG